MRLTKIIATIGPASSNEAVLTKLIQSGVDVFRFNLSHGNATSHRTNLKAIRKISARLKKEVGILFDLAGPKLRVGKMAEPVELKKNQQFILTSRKIIGTEKEASVSQARIIKDLKPKDKVLLSEGRIELQVKSKTNTDLICVVKESGVLDSNKGINVTAPLTITALTKKDHQDIDFAIQQKADWLALSFVRKPSDITKLKNILKQKRANIAVMAKIEKIEAVENIDSIIEVSDGIMIARGDLGIEMPLEEVPLIQKEVITKCMKRGKTVVTATQMLESMVNSLRPTRAEVNDVANAIFDQTDAVMLSAETAVGKYPVQAFQTMAKVAAKTEQAIDYGQLLAEKDNWVISEVTDAISYASCELVNDLDASLLVTSTQSGTTAKKVAAYRPPAPILAVTPDPSVIAKLKLVWGVVPHLTKPSKEINDMFAKAKQAAAKSALVHKNDRIVITAGALVNLPGTTNLIKVDQI